MQARLKAISRGALTRTAVCIAALLGAALVHAQSGAISELDKRFARSALQIATPDARLHNFDVWIADSDARRARGLMFVRELADTQGMLFVYPHSQPIGMWMKNTFIPLDMLFVRADGRVERVVEYTTPHSLATIESLTPVLAVIELNAGVTAQLKIRPGAQVLHAAFGSGKGR